MSKNTTPEFVIKSIAKIAIKNSDIPVLENLVKKGFEKIVKNELEKFSDFYKIVK
jgi:precorrin-6B methylase 1